MLCVCVRQTDELTAGSLFWVFTMHRWASGSECPELGMLHVSDTL